MSFLFFTKENIFFLEIFDFIIKNVFRKPPKTE
jgi:hypothetical protein